MEQRNENKTELKMIKMSDVQSQTVDWLWYPFIPYGKLTIIQGDPGDGKTTLICVIFLLICRRTEKAWNLISQAKICLICGKSRRWNTTLPNLSPIKKLKNWILRHESVNEMNF